MKKPDPMDTLAAQQRTMYAATLVRRLLPAMPLLHEPEPCPRAGLRRRAATWVAARLWGLWDVLDAAACRVRHAADDLEQWGHRIDHPHPRRHDDLHLRGKAVTWRRYGTLAPVPGPPKDAA